MGNINQINNMYGTDYKIGDIIYFRGNVAKIKSTWMSYLRIHIFGDKHDKVIHPTWKVEKEKK